MSPLAAKCLSELYKIMVKNVTFVSCRWGDRPNRPLGSAPGCMHNLKQAYDSVLKTVAQPGGNGKNMSRDAAF